MDDHPIVREHLTALINQENDLEVCAQADDARKAMTAIATRKPDLVIVDLSLKGVHWLELMKDVRARYPSLPMLVLSMHDESLYAERTLRAGGQGYISKHEATTKVMTAIRRVLKGEIYLSEKMSTKLLHAYVRGRPPAALPVTQLTDRELEVFELVGHGRTTQQIAQALRLDMSTIETYRSRIKEKLALGSSTELIQHAVEWVRDQGAT